MYEAEVNTIQESIDSVPLEIRQRFAELRDQVQARSLLPWAEHCTECNWPVCYTSCELYTRRSDGACRLFVDGMVRIDYPEGANPYLLKMRFKRWGKLWAKARLHLYSQAEATRNEKANILTGAIARTLPMPKRPRERILRKVAYWRRNQAERALPNACLPDSFVVEAYNPNDRAISLTLTIRAAEGEGSVPFQRLLTLERGFNRHEIHAAEMSDLVANSRLFETEIVPNDANDTVLYFGLIDFIKRRAAAASSPASNSKGKHWKCIIWDLDNTLWDGVLIEDGIGKIRLRQPVVDVIKELDRRGILHSIASKNNPEEALKFLEMCGLSEYFLVPQINWEPKSQSIAGIAKALNIGLDSMVFVDDQPFEREEVATTLPAITVLDAAQYASIPDLPECQVPITDESRSRRIMYRQQQRREAILGSHNGDYKSFLKACDIRLTISALDGENLERVYELAQRTNQMNFSGNRYPREALRQLIGAPGKETFVIKCDDKFGTYGIVGFSVVDVSEPRLLDLMFSCRIQSKRIEHAFLAYLLGRFADSSERNFFANYRKTPKNAPSGKVFEEMGFKTVADKDGISSLIFPAGRTVENEGIIRIVEADVLEKKGGHAEQSSPLPAVSA